VLAGLHEESVLAGLQVAERGPGMCGSTRDVAGAEVLRGAPRVSARELQLVRRRLEERRRGLESDQALLLVSHVRVFAASVRTPRAYCRSVDEAWRPRGSGGGVACPLIVTSGSRERPLARHAGAAWESGGGRADLSRHEEPGRRVDELAGDTVGGSGDTVALR
jgi:hypothetical protein